MPETAATIDLGGGSGGGSSLLSNPRLLAIGGGIVLAVGLFLWNSRSGGTDAPATERADTLSPSSALALGQIAYDQTRLAGEAGVRDAAFRDEFTAFRTDLIARINVLDERTDDASEFDEWVLKRLNQIHTLNEGIGLRTPGWKPQTEPGAIPTEDVTTAPSLSDGARSYPVAAVTDGYATGAVTETP